MQNPNQNINIEELILYAINSQTNELSQKLTKLIITPNFEDKSPKFFTKILKKCCLSLAKINSKINNLKLELNKITNHQELGTLPDNMIQIQKFLDTFEDPSCRMKIINICCINKSTTINNKIDNLQLERKIVDNNITLHYNDLEPKIKNLINLEEVLEFCDLEYNSKISEFTAKNLEFQRLKDKNRIRKEEKELLENQIHQFTNKEVDNLKKVLKKIQNKSNFKTTNKSKTPNKSNSNSNSNSKNGKALTSRKKKLEPIYQGLRKDAKKRKN